MSRERKRVQKFFTGVSRTKTNFKEMQDVNNIIKKCTGNSRLIERIGKNPCYGDFTSVGEFQEAMEKVSFAREQFELLPSHVRKRFGNDPVGMLQFVADPKNKEEMIKMGLAIKKSPGNVINKENNKNNIEGSEKVPPIDSDGNSVPPNQQKLI